MTPGEKTDFRFTINGPDGKPVTGFTPLHGKRLHLIVAQRAVRLPASAPDRDRGGVWTVPIELPKPGVYRFFTDVQPDGAARQLTLGTDVFAPGDMRRTPLPQPERVAKVDGYEVRLTGGLTPGKSTELTLTVSKDGKPVTDLQPYLEAYGHLVALRQGDLAYLHVHPDGEPGDGETKPGPGITFFAEAPSAAHTVFTWTSSTAARSAPPNSPCRRAMPGYRRKSRRTMTSRTRTDRTIEAKEER